MKGSGALREHPDGVSGTGRAYTGFWKSGTCPWLPDPRDFVDETWDASERGRVADYLDGGRVVAAYRGWSTCRICDKMNGNQDLGDGDIVWPSSFGHYARKHAVRPPAALVERALRRGRVPPARRA